VLLANSTLSLDEAIASSSSTILASNLYSSFVLTKSFELSSVQGNRKLVNFVVVTLAAGRTVNRGLWSYHCASSEKS
jgi:hypothetical protein